MSTVEPVTRTSANITADRLVALKNLIPEAFTEGKIDFTKLREALGDIVDDGPERYNFTWAGKRDAIRMLQAPTNATLIPCPEESINWDTTQHLFIEGDNLEVLKLLYKAYFGKVKLIYLDPPYNTGHDFIYPDNYTEPLRPYLQITGQMDSGGNRTSTNTEASGRYHSAWLNMMYPRLFLARQLLREDGAIFISIDDNELHNLKKLCDEIFGEENFIATFIWQRVFSPKNTARYVSEDHDYILVYAKHKTVWSPQLLPRSAEADSRYTNPDNDPRGPWSSSDLTARNYYGDGQYTVTGPTGKTFGPGKGRYWRQNARKFQELDADGRIWWGEHGDNMPRLKRYLSEVKDGIVPQTLLLHTRVGNTQEAKKELLEYAEFDETENVLNSVKPTRLLRHLIKIGTAQDSDDIVLDFFAGSGPTAHSVLQQNIEDGSNRRFILVQLPEPLPIQERTATSISDLAKSRLRNVVQETINLLPERSQQHEDMGNLLGFRVFKLASSHFRDWPGVTAPTPDAYLEQMDAFADPLFAGFDPHAVIWEVAIKEGYPLTSRIESAVVQGHTIHRVVNPETGAFFHICLDATISHQIVAALHLTKDDLFICRDLALDDSTAANLALQCRLKTL